MTLFISLAKIFLSPFLLFILTWILTGERREAYLISLIVSTFVYVMGLLSGIHRNSTPLKLPFFAAHMVTSVLGIISLAGYWLIYLVFWGFNFGLDQTFAIF